ncbi:MAG: hypothetical protein AAF748_15655 [Pseudomonadota bacterium]
MHASQNSDSFGLILAAGLIALCVGVFAVNTSQTHDAMPKTPFGISAVSFEAQHSGARPTQGSSQGLPQIGRS